MLKLHTLKTVVANRVKLRFFDSLTCPNHSHLVRKLNLPVKKVNRFGKDRLFSQNSDGLSMFSQFDEDLSFACPQEEHISVEESKMESNKGFLNTSAKPDTAQDPDRLSCHKTVVLIHGFPEIWWSWKYQLECLTQSGYRVIALDLRGFGGSDCPPTPTEYDAFTVANDVLHLLRSLKIKKFSIIAHGMGAEVGHFIALYAPRHMVECIISINYMYLPPSRAKTFAAREEAAGPTFDFILSHIESAIEAQYEERMDTLFRRLFASGGVSCDPPKVLSSQRSAGSTIIDRLGEPICMPYYFDAEDMQYYLENYRRTGFAGPVNHIRNMDINIQKFTSLRSQIVPQPALIVLGDHDILFDTEEEHQAAEGYRNSTLKLISDGGSFLQLQRKDEVNNYIIPFLKTHANLFGCIA